VIPLEPVVDDCRPGLDRLDGRPHAGIIA
jgi:hypothetical protein